MGINYYAINTDTRQAVFLGRSGWLDGIAEVAIAEIPAFVRKTNSARTYPWPSENIEGLITALINVRPTIEAMEGYGEEYWTNRNCVCIGGVEPDEYYVGRQLDGELITNGT